MPQLNELAINPAVSPTPESTLSSSPVTAAAPTETASPAPSATAGEPEIVNPFNLPPELARIPAVQLVSVGAPPAVRVGPGEYYPELDPLVDRIDEVITGGLDIYKALDESLVMFNPLFMTAEELIYLDQQGKLATVVPDYGEVTGSQPQEISDEQVASFVDRGDAAAAKMREISGPGEEPTPVQATGTPTPVPGPTPAEQGAVLNSQAKGIKAFGGEPTSGPRPGGGRLLNALLQPPTT